MTTEEFSNGFDTLLSSYQHKAEFGEQSSVADITLDEYEKSVFLTKAQENIIISLYSGKNSTGDSFEKTEELRKYLSPLVETKFPTKTNSEEGSKKLSTNSTFYELGNLVWFIVYEAVKLNDSETNGCMKNQTIVVTPITHDDYFRISKNPFRLANNRRALRLDVGTNLVEIICKYVIDSYFIRYIKKPLPIILTSLPDGLSIDNESDIKNCSLHPALHRTILDEAVRLALASKGIGINNQSK